MLTTNWDIENKKKKKKKKKRKERKKEFQQYAFLYPLERALINDILIITNDTSSTRPNNRDFHVQISSLNYPELARTGRISSPTNTQSVKQYLLPPDRGPLHYLNLNSWKRFASIDRSTLFYSGMAEMSCAERNLCTVI